MLWLRLAFTNSIILLALFAFVPQRAQAQAVEAALPDLTVDRVTFDAQRRATATITNRGDAPAPLTNPRGYIQMRFWNTSGSPAGAAYNVRELLPLNPGQNMAAFWPSGAPIPSGDNLELRVQIVIPPVWNAEQNRFAPVLEESDDTNNSASARPISEPRVQGVTFHPDTHVPQVIITNTGAMPHQLTTPPLRLTYRWFSTITPGVHEETRDLPYVLQPSAPRVVVYSGASENVPRYGFGGGRLRLSLRQAGELVHERTFDAPSFAINLSGQFVPGLPPSVTVRNSGVATLPQPPSAYPYRLRLVWRTGGFPPLYISQTELSFPFSLRPDESRSVSASLSSTVPANARLADVSFIDPPTGRTLRQALLTVVHDEDSAENIVEEEEHAVVFLVNRALEEETEAQPVGGLPTPDVEVVPFEGREEESGVSRQALTAEETAEEEQRVSARAPRILPGNPLYIFRSLGRELRALVTLDPQRDAALRLRYANEKILEANALVDRGNSARAVAHLRSYTRELERGRTALTAAIERNPEAAGALVEKTAKTQLLHQVLVGKVERVSSPERASEIRETKERISQAVSDTIGQIEKPEEVQRIVSEALGSDGSPFRSLRNLEVLSAVEQKVPEQAKEAISKAKENTIKQVVRQIESLPESQKALVDDYIGKVGGDALEYVKTIDAAAKQADQSAVKDALESAKAAATERLEEKTKLILEKDPEYAKKLIEMKEQIKVGPAPEATKATEAPAEPVFCTQQYQPVCGKDGNTYSNRCVAEKQKQAEVAYEGECKKDSASALPAKEFSPTPDKKY